jgi:hypothetical protein
MCCIKRFSQDPSAAFPQPEDGKASAELLAELLALKAENDQLMSQYHSLKITNQQFQTEYDNLKAENEQLMLEIQRLIS